MFGFLKKISSSTGIKGLLRKCLVLPSKVIPLVEPKPWCYHQILIRDAEKKRKAKAFNKNE